jgi:hypothetical protein
VKLNLDCWVYFWDPVCVENDWNEDGTGWVYMAIDPQSIKYLEEHHDGRYSVVLPKEAGQ